MKHLDHVAGRAGPRPAKYGLINITIVIPSVTSISKLITMVSLFLFVCRYRQMCSCWSIDAGKRPCAEELVEYFQNIDPNTTVSFLGHVDYLSTKDNCILFHTFPNCLLFGCWRILCKAALCKYTICVFFVSGPWRHTWRRNFSVVSFVLILKSTTCRLLYFLLRTV